MRINLSKFLLAFLLSFYFIMLLINYIIYFARISIILNIIYIFCWITLLFFAFFILLFLTIKSYYFRRILQLVLIIVSGVILIFFLLNTNFLFTKIQAALILIITIIAAKYERHNYNFYNFKFTNSAKALLILMPVILSFILITPTNYIAIRPQNRPEINFWGGACAIPNDPELLSFMAENNISFTVVLRESYINDDDGKSEAESIRQAIEAGIKLDICIGNDYDFYLSLDNAESFKDIFNYIRSWLIDNELYGDIRSFCVDAEPSPQLISELSGLSAMGKIAYLFQNINASAFSAAMNTLNSIINTIHSDGKSMGIVKMAAMYDEFDNDNDINALVRNVYNLDIDWDYSVSMIYRTRHVPTIFNIILNSLEEYSYITSNYELEYYSLPEYERYIMDISNFYYKTGYEISGSDVNVIQENRYIAIGTFWSKFWDTTYIQNKEYLSDLDICRHFNVGKIYLYNYRGFVLAYGESEIYNLIEHINKKEIWTIHVYNWYLNREVIFGLFTIFFDFILKI